MPLSDSGAGHREVTKRVVAMIDSGVGSVGCGGCYWVLRSGSGVCSVGGGGGGGVV